MAASEEGSISEGNVSVVVRVRPPNQREKESSQQIVVQVVDGSMLVFDPEEPDPAGVFAGLRTHDATKRKGKDLKFVFDHVFGETSRQQEVFEHTTRDILDGVLDGYNCSVFAYGATGAGKTHTMLGSETDPGVMFLTMVELYRRIDDIKEEKCCEVLLSYLEVYNEQIQDLLEPKGFLAIREDPQKGVIVQGLSLHQPKSAEQLLQMLANGNKNRTQHPTDANATSSRSHAVFQIYVKQQDRAAGINRRLRVAKMSLIDLAGSERASTTNAKGDRQREGANINRSLLALINVINALADAKSKKPHIPYRDSKLTRLLKDSLGGNCRTVMIATISPSYLSYDDTYNTLKYANRAKEIKLSLKSNVISLDCHISKYAAVCEELKAEVAELRQRLHTYECGGMAADAQDVHEEAVKKSEIYVQEKTHCRMEKPPGVTEVTREDICIDFEETGSRLREFNARTSARRRDMERARLSCDATKDLQPSPKYCIRLRSRNAAMHRPTLQNRRPSEQSMNRMERLVNSLLRLVRDQQSALRAAKLQTPEMKAEYEELERLVQQENGALWGADATVPPPEKMGPLLQQPTDSRGQLVGKLFQKTEPSLAQDLKEGDGEVSSPVQIETLPSSRTRLSMERARLLDPKQEKTDRTARTRRMLKRCRRQLLSDNSPTVESPVVPVKKRRWCKGSPMPQVSLEASISRERQSKHKDKSLFTCSGRGSLNREGIAPPSDNSCTPLIMPDSSQKMTTLCTPKRTFGGTPKNCTLIVTKARMPLATSAAQNCATVRKAPLPLRDLNTTFDLSEEGWYSSAMDKTVTFGPSAFSGWENIACHLRPTDGTSIHRPEVAIFTMKGPSVLRSSAPQPPSTVKKSNTQRRRRSISVSTSKSKGGPYSHSRIARLSNSTAKKPSTIAERVTCSPRWQSDRKTRKTGTAIGRVLSSAPASRSLQFAQAKSF